MPNDARVLGLALVLGLILAGVVAWCVFIPRFSAGTQFRYLPRRNVPWGLIDLVLAMAVILVTSSVAEALLVKFDITEPGQDLANMSAENAATMLLVRSAAMFAGVLLSLVLIWLKNRPTAGDFGFSFGNLRGDVFAGIVTFVLVAPLVYAIQYLLVEILGLPSAHPLIELVKKNPDSLFFAVGVAVLVAPVTEEILFRVLLQGWLERIPGFRGDTKILLLGGTDVLPEAIDNQSAKPEKGKPRSAENSDRGVADERTDNPYVAPRLSSKGGPPGVVESPPSIWPVVVSSALFALLHLPHGVDPIPLFVLAFGLGLVYRQTHSALPCIIIHMLFNGFSVALLMVEVYG